MSGFTSGLSCLCHWPTQLSLCQHRTLHSYSSAVSFEMGKSGALELFLFKVVWPNSGSCAFPCELFNFYIYILYMSFYINYIYYIILLILFYIHYNTQYVFFFIVTLLQLSQFFPLCPPLPSLPASPTVSPHPVVYVPGSFIHVLWLVPSPPLSPLAAVSLIHVSMS